MVVDIGKVRQQIKPKADSTLYNMRKKDLISYVRTLENNYNVAVSFNENQARYIESLGVTVQKWIPVTERLPAPASKRNRYNGKCWTSETVLCVCVQNGGKRMVKEGRCEFYGDTPVWRIPGTIDSVTHWMPLPESPKEEA